MPGGAARGQPEPGHALFGGLNQVEALAAEGDAEPADLADRLGDALEEPRVVIDQEAGAVGTARLLVGEEGQDHIAGRAAALTQALADHGQDHRVHVLHVDGAAAPDARVVRAIVGLVADVAGEGVDLPVRRIGGDHVEVAVDEQGGPLWSSPVMRVTTLARDLSDSRMVGSRPTSARSPATYSAAWRSPGPWLSPRLEVSILMRSLHRPATSS